MKEVWKWIERAAWIIAIFSGFKVMGMDNVIIFIKQFWSSLSPWQFLFIMSIIILLCQFIIFMVNLYKKTNGIISDVNNLKKWIGRFSYEDKKGSYVDLKGKIKRYINEELESSNMLKNK